MNENKEQVNLPVTLQTNGAIDNTTW